MDFNKIFFFYRQFSIGEFISLAYFRLFKYNQAGVKRDTLKFYEEQFKSKTKLLRNGNISRIYHVVNGKDLQINLRRFSSDVLVFTQVMSKGEFDPVIEIFRQESFVPQYIIDGGANIGLSTLYLKCFYPEAHVATIEPNDATFQMLTLNVEQNSFLNTSQFKAGLWSTNERLQSAVEIKGNEWGFSVQVSRQHSSINSIEGRTVQSIVQQLGWPRIDYLKIDIEGAEEELFKSKEVYHPFLSITKSISLEVHGKALEGRIKSILMEYGFQLHEFGELIFGYLKN